MPLHFGKDRVLPLRQENTHNKTALVKVYLLILLYSSGVPVLIHDGKTHCVAIDDRLVVLPRVIFS
jgi:hypothetical protein